MKTINRYHVKTGCVAVLKDSWEVAHGTIPETGRAVNIYPWVYVLGQGGSRGEKAESKAQQVSQHWVWSHNPVPQ